MAGSAGMVKPFLAAAMTLPMKPQEDAERLRHVSITRGRADEAVALIGKLYRIEREHKDATDAMRLLARQQHSMPALAALHAWLEKTRPAVTPKSALGTAISYMSDYWSMLTRYPLCQNRCRVI